MYTFLVGARKKISIEKWLNAHFIIIQETRIREKEVRDYSENSVSDTRVVKKSSGISSGSELKYFKAGKGMCVFL